VKEKIWQPAVDWYENRIENPPGYQDSVFAVIDLGDIHLMMAVDTLGGAKSGSVFYRLREIKPKSKNQYKENKATLLATLPQITKPKNEKEISQNDNIIPQKAQGGALGQNIPNPASESTTINFEMFAEGTAEIVIYNLTGQIVKSLPQGILPEGGYQAKVSVTGLAVGMYHYALFVNGERVDAKKMVVN
jgi:hypothetical protein